MAPLVDRTVPPTVLFASTLGARVARTGTAVGSVRGARVGATMGNNVGSGSGARVVAAIGARVGGTTGARVVVAIGARVGGGSGAATGTGTAGIGAATGTGTGTATGTGTGTVTGAVRGTATGTGAGGGMVVPTGTATGVRTGAGAVPPVLSMHPPVTSSKPTQSPTNRLEQSKRGMVKVVSEMATIVQLVQKSATAIGSLGLTIKVQPQESTEYATPARHVVMMRLSLPKDRDVPSDSSIVTGDGVLTTQSSTATPVAVTSSEQPTNCWALAKRDLLLVMSPMNALTTTIVIAAVFIEERNEDKMDGVMMALMLKND